MSTTDAAPDVNAAKTKAQTIDEWTAELEAIAIEVAVGIAGIAGGGFWDRSPHATRLVQAARARDLGWADSGKAV